MSMMEIITPTVSNQVREELVAHSTDADHKDVWELAYEFCNKFNTKVERASGGCLYLVIPEADLPVGFLRVDKILGDTIYNYKSDIFVKKQHAGKTDRMTRSASTIPALVKAVKSKDLAITAENFSSALLKEGGARYIHASLTQNSSSRADILSRFGRGVTSNGDLMLKIVTNIVRPSSQNALTIQEITALQEVLSNCEQQLGQLTANDDVVSRFAKGMYVVCIERGNERLQEKAHYYVYDHAIFGDDGVILTQTPVKRYSTLQDHPELAPIAMMIRTAMPTESQNSFAKANEFGVQLADKYYADMDFVTGYLRSDKLWLAIPKTPF